MDARETVRIVIAALMGLGILTESQAGLTLDALDEALAGRKVEDVDMNRIANEVSHRAMLIGVKEDR